ncbi:MAG: FHA domain-containing protein [Bacteroidales bacterium]|nr:FHA domain-containing protein [Bacteroidales bacterium]
MSEFKKCPNGHYYQGDHCPYCKSDNGTSRTSVKTEIYAGGASTGGTVPIDGMDYTRSTKTTVSGSGYQGTVPNGGSWDTRTETTVVGGPTRRPTKTEFGEPTDPSAGGDAPRKYCRKLVGWLVTYSFDELGQDYKLYEGRNIIGRDEDCNIVVNDGRVSGKHAVLLFKANKYSITDTQSSHGTFVNDEDIEFESRYLKDGDVIRMGNTIFKFRSSF